MESTIANVDLGRYRKIVQMFWDPEPSNDLVLDQPVWCLGRSYKLHDSKRLGETSPGQNDDNTKEGAKSLEEKSAEQNKPALSLPGNAPDTPPESAATSFASTSPNSADSANGWPQAFIADFESRIWMTYRSEFTPIPRSPDPKAATAMSLQMRIKYQLGDQTGFSSDSGWGCMIRSGQSLLANAIGIVRLGRGKHRSRNATRSCSLP